MNRLDVDVLVKHLARESCDKADFSHGFAARKAIAYAGRCNLLKVIGNFPVLNLTKAQRALDKLDTA